ncbi:MAG: tetratricopeptide repeat-containing sensor histidine kinase [bacterium]|nr:tetratricopeptide repeat-containing sensor histidine kinase [bacterium]
MRFHQYSLIVLLILLCQTNIIGQVNIDKLDQYKEQIKFIGEFRLENKDSALVLAHQNLQLAEASGSPWALAKAHTQIGLILRNLYQYEESISYHEKAIEFAKDSDSLSLMPDLLNDLALAVISIDQDQRSINLRLQSIPLYQKIKDFDGMANAYYNLGFDYKYVGKIDSAVYYLEEASNIGDRLGIHDLYIMSNNVLGNIRSDEGRFLEALNFQQKALKRAEETEDKGEIATVLSNIAILYKNLEDFDRAEESYLKAIEMANDLGRDDVHFTHFNIAIMHSDLSQNEKSKEQFLKAFNLREKVGEKRYILTAAAMLADMYQILGVQDSSDYYSQYASSLLNQVNSKSSIASALEVLGNVNLNQSNYEVAQEQLTEAYRIYKELGYEDALYDAAYSLYLLHKKLGNSEQAVGFLEEYIQLKDSIVSEEQIMAITRLDEGYKHDKEILQKQNEISLLESKEQVANLKVTLLIIGIAIIVIAGFLIARYLLLKKERKKKQLEEVSQFKEAMTGMIAHDLKNPLGIILGTESEKPSTRLMARQMLNLVNNMLDVHKFENTSVKLDMSSFSLQAIVAEATENVRPLLSEKNLVIESLIDEEVLVKADHEYLLRVLVNLFTNAIKYSPNNASIKVMGEKLGERVSVSVTDEGTGIAKQDQQKIFESFGQVDARKSGGVGSTGLGLSFCQLAVRAHGSELIVESEIGSGTTFKFELDLSNQGTVADLMINDLTFTMSSNERQVVISKIPELRSKKLHQAFEIEEILESIDSENETVNSWTEKVISAAYANNEVHYNELLDMVLIEEE